ncbi:MAG TPA: ATP synthase F0 subunit B [Terracidiphilus sp.]|nr:ATP synthase F0 subunit B [Terracidiphilus sp.]
MSHISLPHSSPRASSWRRLAGLALLALLTVAPAAVAVPAFAQETAAHLSGAAYANPAVAETPRKEERQEEGFLNAPVVHELAGLMHMSEPAARTTFLAINFAIIFFAIAIPLARIMPKIFRRRSETLRQDLDLARKATEEARQRLSAVEARLAGLDREIAAFRAQVEQESLEEEKRIKASIKEESERIVAAAEQEIGAAAMQARRALRVFAADLAIEHAEKQLALTPETDHAVIEEFIGHFGKQGAVESAGRGGRR